MKHKINFTPSKKNSKPTSTVGEKLFLFAALLFTFFLLTMNTQDNLGSSVTTTSLGQGFSLFNKLKTDFSSISLPSNQLTGAAVVNPSGTLAIQVHQGCNNTIAPLTLDSNLSCETATLNITSSNVFIDCAGYSVNYGGSSTGNGIDLATTNGVNNITIKNCNFRQTNAYTGSSSNGAIKVYGNNVTIWNNTFIVNSPSTGAAIYVSNSNFTNISFNTITQNGSYTSNGSAISLSDAFEAIVEDNNINTTANNAYGLLYTTTGNTTIRRNLINTTRINATGISLTNLVRGTTIQENRITTTGSGGGFGNPDTNTVTITTSNNLIFRSNTLKSVTASSSTLILDTVNNSMIDNNTVENLASKSLELLGNTHNNVLLNNNITAPVGKYEIDDRNGFDNDTVYYNYLMYNNSFGEVAWQNNGTGSLLHEMRISIAGSLSLGETIYIANNTIAINTSAVFPLFKFNSSANITLRGLDLATVGQIHKVGNFTTNSTEIKSAGIDCNASGGCSILSYSSNVLRFNTTGFSSFSANLSVAAAASTSSCGTISTSTTLLNSITSTAGCITINASHIFLDCANYLINYSLIGDFGHGINITGFNNVTIKNCLIREWSVNTSGKHAINLLNGGNITIWNNTIQTVAGGSSAISATGTLTMNISNNIMYTNGSSAHVIILSTSNNATIISNLLNTTPPNTNSYGINLLDTGNNTIAFNVINSSSTALYISGKSNNNISYNNLTSSGNPGTGALSLLDVNYNKIHFNQINSTGASVYGVYIYPSSHNLFGENIIRTKQTTSNNNAYFFRGGDNNTLTHDNIAASVSSNQLRLQDTNVTMINMSFNKYNLSFDDASTGTLTVQWNVYVNVSNNTGSALTNANVTIFNVSSLLEQSERTGSDGEVTLVVTEFRQTATEKIFSTPHTINTSNSTYVANSTTINISNSNSTFQNIVLSFANIRPTAPAYLQIDYRNLSATTNRTPIFIWQNATDIEGDIFSYHIQVDDNAIFNNPEINVTAIAPTSANINTTYYAAATLSVDTRYFWRVRANDSTGYGDWSNGATTDGPSSNQNLSNFTVDSLLQLTLTNSAVEFGTLTMGANISSADSTSDNILPLRGENTGNIQLNISINATALFSSVAMNKSNYQFRIAENESDSFSVALSSTSWANMSTSTSAFHLVNLSWQSIKNDFLLHLNLSLPFDEPAGLKSSSILLTVTSNE